MAKETLYEFLQALQSSMSIAQEALKKRFEAPMQRICEIDSAGAAGASVTAFAVPLRGGGEEGFESLSILSFKGQCPRLTMLSMEIECAFKRMPRSGGAGTYLMMIRKGKLNFMKRGKSHRMQIAFNFREKPLGKVSIDGRPYIEVPACDLKEKRSDPYKAEERSSFLKRIFNRIRSIWEPQGFILTEEQSEKASEILECRASETWKKR